MAQLDTGLGWSAKDTWLYRGTGDLATITHSNLQGDFPCWPEDNISRPNVTSWLVPKGIYYMPSVSSHGVEYPLYTTTNANSLPPLGYFIAPVNNAYHLFIVASENFNIPYMSGWFRIWYLDNGYPNPVTQSTGGSTIQDPVTGLYYRDQDISDRVQADTSAQSTIPFYASFADGMAAMAGSVETFSKTNQGFAVACVAKWKTRSGTILASPILISSDTSFADMSTNGTYQFAKYRTRRDGMTFYMSFYQDISGELISTLPEYDISGPDDPYANLDELFNLICASDQANVLVTESVDPYEEFPPTGEDAGEVDPDPEDDDIEEVDLPTMSFATAGFCRIYRPSFAQVSALASYMWTDQNFLQTVINHLKQILENPIDAIISLSIVPCVPNVLTDEEVKVMYVPTGVYMPPVQRQFVSVDCGTYTLKEMYGSALDYNPYTSVQLYLPYVGIVQLDTDEVMGKTLSIGYRIDVVTGVCCAYVKANGDVLYQFSGHCSIQQPITSADFSGYINAALAAGKLVASIAAAGAGAPAVAATLAGAPTPSISGSESKTVETERNPNTGRQITVGTRKRESQTYNPGASFGEVATRGVSNTVGAVMNSKTIVQHSGGFSGNSGFMAAVRRPYLIVTRPRIANPENYGKYNGRPSMIYLNLGDCTGFTQVQSIQLTGIDATNPELSEIATLLNSGVIL